MMQTPVAHHTISGVSSSVTSEQNSAKSTASSCNEPLFSQIIQVMLMAHEFQSDVLTLAEALSQQVSQLLRQIAAQYPDCCASLEGSNLATPHSNPREQVTAALRVTSPLDKDWPVLQNMLTRQSPIHFTGREWDILHMMLDGLSNREIADRLVIAVSTVKWYVNQLYSKLDVHSREEAINSAKKLILVDRMAVYTTQKPDEHVNVPVGAKIAAADARLPKLNDFGVLTDLPGGCCRACQNLDSPHEASNTPLIDGDGQLPVTDDETNSRFLAAD